MVWSRFSSGFSFHTFKISMNILQAAKHCRLLYIFIKINWFWKKLKTPDISWHRLERNMAIKRLTYFLFLNENLILSTLGKPLNIWYSSIFFHIFRENCLEKIRNRLLNFVFSVRWCLFIANNINFLTHVTHMRSVRYERYAYGKMNISLDAVMVYQQNMYMRFLQ